MAQPFQRGLLENQALYHQAVPMEVMTMGVLVQQARLH